MCLVWGVLKYVLQRFTAQSWPAGSWGLSSNLLDTQECSIVLTGLMPYKTRHEHINGLWFQGHVWRCFLNILEDSETRKGKARKGKETKTKLKLNKKSRGITVNQCKPKKSKAKSYIAGQIKSLQAWEMLGQIGQNRANNNKVKQSENQGNNKETVQTITKLNKAR